MELWYDQCCGGADQISARIITPRQAHIIDFKKVSTMAENLIKTSFSERKIGK